MAASRTRRMGVCLCLLLACFSAVSAQLTSSTDANGNIIVLSVGVDAAGDPATTTLSTIEAAGEAGLDSTAAPAVTLGQVGASPSSSSSVPPTTYRVYYTPAGGAQTWRYDTFFATTPTPSTTIAPSSGTVLAFSSYMPTATPTASHTGEGKRKYAAVTGQVAAFGVLLSMLVGAIAVW